jgi:hypothetical protein
MSKTRLHVSEGKGRRSCEDDESQGRCVECTGGENAALVPLLLRSSVILLPVRRSFEYLHVVYCTMSVGVSLREEEATDNDDSDAKEFLADVKHGSDRREISLGLVTISGRAILRNIKGIMGY